MTRRVNVMGLDVVFIVLAAFAAGMVMAWALPRIIDPHTTVNVVRCEEDQPCWDCTTMGNKICGAATTR